MKNRKITKKRIEVEDIPFIEVEEKEHINFDFNKMKLEWFCFFKWHKKTEIKGNIAWQLVLMITTYYISFAVMLIIDLALATLVVMGKYFIWEFLLKRLLWQFLIVKLVWELLILNIAVWTYKELFKSVFVKVLFWAIMFTSALLVYYNWSFIVSIIK